MISHEELLRRVSYDEHTGIFIRTFKGSKNTNVGDVANKNADYGYDKVSVAGKCYKAHRLAWFYHYKQWPDGDIDHINGDRKDNRIANLRCVKRKTNQENMHKAQKNNKEGLLGVCYNKDKKKYRATITDNYKSIHLGYFKDPDEAHKVYIQAKRYLHAGCTI